MNLADRFQTVRVITPASFYLATFLYSAIASSSGLSVQRAFNSPSMKVVHSKTIARFLERFHSAKPIRVHHIYHCLLQGRA